MKRCTFVRINLTELSGKSLTTRAREPSGCVVADSGVLARAHTALVDVREARGTHPAATAGTRALNTRSVIGTYR